MGEGWLRAGEEADLRPVDKSRLPTGDDGAGGFVSGAGDYERVAGGRPLLHWFLLAGLGVLAVELAFQILVGRRAP